MNRSEQAAVHAPQYKALVEQFKKDGVQFLQSHTVDTNGNLRSKLSPLKLSADGDALNAILYCVSHGDGEPIGDTAFASPLACDDNGYPNICALPDPASLRQHGWRRDTASVISSGYMLDGAPCAVDPRHILAAADQRLRAQGFQASVALEYEFGIFTADPALTREGRFSELQPWGGTLTNYDLVRSGEYQDLVAEFMRRLDSLGIGVSSFVTEYGYGMYEFALTPKPPLEAADDAARAKLHLRELCAEHGLIATFMTRFQPPGKHSACGAHHHISLWQDGKPALPASGGGQEISPAGRHFLAGMLAHMAETHVFFRPTINSYRRFDRGAWSPQDVSWGFENRMAAIRAITTPNAGACRFEHRLAGADVNPYLTTAAILHAGAAGLERGLEPPAACAGDPQGCAGVTPLHANLSGSLAAFEASEFCRDSFGAVFHGHYAASRRNEIDAFETWQSQRITEFEWQRYF